MEESMPNRRTKLISNASSDIDYYTPEYALDYILEHIALYKDKVVWECCCGKGHISKWLRSKGFSRVIETDLKETGHDFFTYEPEEYDIIITNPPFKGKRLFIERCLSLRKPCFLLLPTMTLESNTIRPLFKQLGPSLGILMPPKSIHYIPSPIYEKDKDVKHLTLKQSRTFFHSSWFTFFIDSVSGIQFM